MHMKTFDTHYNNLFTLPILLSFSQSGSLAMATTVLLYILWSEHTAFGVLLEMGEWEEDSLRDTGTICKDVIQGVFADLRRRSSQMLIWKRPRTPNIKERLPWEFSHLWWRDVWRGLETALLGTFGLNRKESQRLLGWKKTGSGFSLRGNSVPEQPGGWIRR